MPNNVTLEGFDDVNAFFDILVENVPAMVTEALVAGAKPMEEELASHTPKGQVVSRFLRNELSSFQVTDIVILSGNRGGYAQIGFSKPGGAVANWLEYGHELVSHRPSLQVVGFAQPRPFMRPAFDVAEESSFNAVAASISGFLDNLPT